MHPLISPRRLLFKPRGVVVFSLPTTLILLLAAGCNDTTTPPQVACTDESGTICTWAGTGFAGFNGDGKTPIKSSLYWPIDVTFTFNDQAYIVDWNNHALRQVTAEGTLRTVVGAGMLGDGPVPSSSGNDRIPPGALGTEIALNHPTDAEVLPDGKILLVIWHNHKMRTYDPTTDLALVICGAGGGFRGDGGPATDALLDQPTKAVVSPTGEIFVVDQRNQRIRKIDAVGNITTVVGTGVAGFSGDGGSPLAAQVHFPAGANPAPGGGIALDTQGRLYFSDSVNNRIRRVDFQADRIETIAGSDGVGGYSGDGGLAVNARFNYPLDIEFGPDGRLYVADQKNNRIRAIELNTGIIVTVVGSGVEGFSGDGGDPLAADLAQPMGIAFDSEGRLYIADTQNSRIRRVNL